jgi:hypothetical protein
VRPQIGTKKAADGNAIQKLVLPARQLHTSFLTALNAFVDAKDKQILKIQTHQQIQIGTKHNANGSARQKVKHALIQTNPTF